jgi:hypothetical protein
VAIISTDEIVFLMTGQAALLTGQLVLARGQAVL